MLFMDFKPMHIKVTVGYRGAPKNVPRQVKDGDLHPATSWARTRKTEEQILLFPAAFTTKTMF